MFQLSDCNLAVAVYNSGCFPTFTLPAFRFGFDFKYFNEVQKFIDITGSNNFSIFIDINVLNLELENKKIYNSVFKYKPKFIEFTTGNFNLTDDLLKTDGVQYFLNYCQDNEIKLILRTSSIVTENLEYIDSINIKGNEAAGGNGNAPIKEMFLEQKKQTPNIPICPSGGIASGEDIDWFLENGAEAVSIGSAFALTKESKMRIEVKNKILNSSSENLSKFIDTNKSTFFINEYSVKDDSSNRTSGLILGLENRGGHVYMGKAIDKINNLMSVDELVNNLVLNSKYLQCLV
jgi:NAD(P)H-dependent flavin oxidoreductase YrpB (nitropropane dioxygenase family)